MRRTKSRGRKLSARSNTPINELYCCTICRFSSRFKGILQTHMEFHETNETTPFLEGSSFSHTTNANSNFETSVENVTDTNVLQRSNRRIDPTCDNNNVNRFHCSSCNLSTFNEESLKSHVNLVHCSSEKGPRIASDSKSQGLERYQNDMNTEKDTRNYCTICDFSTLYKENLTFHVATVHSTSKKRLNNVSIKTEDPISNLPDLSTQSRKYGTKFYCTICDFSTLHKANLKSHIDTFHSSSKTRDKNIHQGNSSSQTSDKPLQYDCASNDLSTFQKTNSKSHTAIVHSPSNTPPRNISPLKTQGLSRNPSTITTQTSKLGPKFCCSICDFSTLYKGNLKAHTIVVHCNSKSSKNALRGSQRFRGRARRCSTPRVSNDERVTNEFSTFRKVNANAQSNIVPSPSKMKPQNTTNVKSESPKRNTKTPVSGAKYYCTICDFSTFYKCNMRPHVKTHAVESKFTCSICDINFRSSESLEKHEKLHFRSDPLPEEELHLETKEIPGLVEISADVGDLQSRKIFSCSICGNRFSWVQNLKRHRANIHKLTADNSPRSLAPTRLFSPNVPRPEGSSCDICGKRFWWAQNLNRHRVKVHNLQNHFTRKRIGNSADVSIEQTEVNRKEKFICNICDREFRYKRHLALHTLAHQSNRKVPLAPSLDSGNKSLPNHSSQQENQDQVLLHLKTEPLDSNASPRAEIQFPIESLIDDQSSRVQLSGEKCFFCKLCGSGYSRKYNLTNHITHYHRQSVLKRNSDPRRHTRNSVGRPTDRERRRFSSIESSKETFICEYCDSRFIRIGRLMRHVKTFHQNMSRKAPDGRAAPQDEQLASIDDASVQLSNFPFEKTESNTAESKRNGFLDSFELFSNDSRDTSNEEGWETSIDTVSESANNRDHDEFEDLELDEVDLNVIVQKYLNNCNEDFDFDFGNVPLDCNNRATSNDLSQKSASNGDLVLPAKSEEPQYVTRERAVHSVDGNTEETRNASVENHFDCSQTQRPLNRNLRKRQIYVDHRECSDTDEESSPKKFNLRPSNQRRIFLESHIDWKSNAAKYLGFRECTVYIKPLPKHCSSYVTLG